MTKGFSLFIFFIPFLTSSLQSQITDTTEVSPDSIFANDSTRSSIVLKTKSHFLIPSMPQLPRLKMNKQSFSLDIRSQYRAGRPEESTNWDALNKPPDQYDYLFQRENQSHLVPVNPQVDPQKKILPPLRLQNYVLPTRSELDILNILWAKEDVQDTTIYSCLDTVLNITMEGLNRLLERMYNKGLVRRKLVSPRNEFNAFGILIEMSPQNRRNRVYEYHTRVDRDLMSTFINANLFLFKHDSSMANPILLEAIRKDSSLLNDLNIKINRVKE